MCIQHTLPHLYSYDGRYKNIGFVAVESSNFKDSGWQRNMNLMDEKMAEVAPPGKEKMVKALKKKYDDPSAPYAIAWSQYNKEKNK